MRDEFPAALKARKSLPILQCHGDEDMVVRVTWGMGSHELLKGTMEDVTFKTYEGMQHSSCFKELKDVSEFLLKHGIGMPSSKL
jgi:lysophospholipase II